MAIGYPGRQQCARLSHGVKCDKGYEGFHRDRPIPDLSSAPPSHDRNPPKPGVKVVAFAYHTAQSQQLHAIGETSFRSSMWLSAMIPTYGMLRLMEHGIGAASS